MEAVCFHVSSIFCVCKGTSNNSGIQMRYIIVPQEWSLPLMEKTKQKKKRLADGANKF